MKEKEFEQTLLRHLEQSSTASENTAKGCTLEQIAEIESKFDCRLPKIYKAFLSRFGNGAGRFFLGSDVFYPSVLELRDWASELLVDDGEIMLNDESFVFAMHQGYQFFFFNLDQNDDPEVHYYMEGKGFEMNKYNSLSDYFLESALCEW